MSKLMDSIIKKATKLGKTIVLPEGEEPRIIEAARLHLVRFLQLEVLL